MHFSSPNDVEGKGPCWSTIYEAMSRLQLLQVRRMDRRYVGKSKLVDRTVTTNYTKCGEKFALDPCTDPVACWYLLEILFLDFFFSSFTTESHELLYEIISSLAFPFWFSCSKRPVFPVHSDRTGRSPHPSSMSRTRSQHHVYSSIRSFKCCKIWSWIFSLRGSENICRRSRRREIGVPSLFFLGSFEAPAKGRANHEKGSVEMGDFLAGM